MKSAISEVSGEIDLTKNRVGGGGFRPPVGARSFAILRVGKISGMGKVAAAAQHNFRERETHNADPDRLDQNRVLAGARDTDELIQKWHDLAPDKVRKNAVHALEYVVTASPEKLAAMSAQERASYFEDTLDWLKEKHGAENILSAVVHEDERSPHLQAMVIPLDERGKLNARALVGGKAQLSAMQTHFAESVGAKYGLERGIQRSGAKHEDIKTYYNRARDVATASVTLPERLSGGPLGAGRETDEEWRARASEGVTEALRTVLAHHDDERQRFDEVMGDVSRTMLAQKSAIERKEAEVDRRGEMLNLTIQAGELREAPDPAGIREFEDRYLKAGQNIEPEIRAVIDQLAVEAGARSFDQLEADRQRDLEQPRSRDDDEHER